MELIICDGKLEIWPIEVTFMGIVGNGRGASTRSALYLWDHGTAG